MSNKKLLDAVSAKINKDLGEGVLMRGSEKPKFNLPSYSTGSIGLDIATGVGGFPCGRITEVLGWESSGKTTHVVHAIADCQKKGGVAAIIDMEHAFDMDYAVALGVSREHLLISQPDNAQQALEVFERLTRSGLVNLIAFDSVAAMVPREEIEGEMGDSKMGIHARLMSQAMRKLMGPIAKNQVCAIFINQLREKIGVMYGNPETTTGGNALKFYASLRIELRKKNAPIKDGTHAVASDVTAKIIKNKLSPPFKVAKYEMKYGIGVDQNKEVLQAAIDFEYIEKKGGTHYFTELFLGEGKEKLKFATSGEKAEVFLNDNIEMRDKLKKIIINKIQEI